MEKATPIQQLLLHSRRLPVLIIGVTLLILAGTILLARQQLRHTIQDQIAGRDAEVLDAVVLMQMEEDAAVLGSMADPSSQLAVILKASRLKGVLGARLFSPKGEFVDAFPAHVLEGELNPGHLPRLSSLRPVSRFHRAVPLSEIFLPEAITGESLSGSVPLLIVHVPLRVRGEGRLLGIAQFIIEGQSIAMEFARLDENLAWQAVAAFGVAGGILVLAIGWSFRRLRRAHRLLAERTTNLLQANQELALAAKTSAIGAVTSHLIHGLKNPLSGLQNFVANLGPADAERLESDWRQAIATTRRMQSMINQVVGVLRDEEGASRYEINLEELSEIISARVLPCARETGVAFDVRCLTEAVLPNRAANLVALILVNLVQNALQATPAGGTISLIFSATGDRRVACEVRDPGAGLPEAMRQNPFVPCHSNKEGGSGIGLAISKQLANHLGAVLELKSSSKGGSVFALVLPPGLGTETFAREVSSAR